MFSASTSVHMVLKWFRAAIDAVPKGQVQAAVALNLTRWQTMRHVVLPQAIVMMLPPFNNLMIELLKSTALVSMITVTEPHPGGALLARRYTPNGRGFWASAVDLFFSFVAHHRIVSMVRTAHHSGH